ncbi:MAG: hypothetical protein ACJ0PK_01215 [Flavobacteriaceae bacterium]|tara:strand:- start:320 stop:838 length:519 start_codon:yes stop_codon:yes gene_type:complete
MKKLNIKYFTVMLIFLFGACEAPTVGYNTYEWAKDYKFAIGSEESIEVALNFDKAWADRDFETMTTFASDSVKFFFGNGIERDFDYVKNSALTQDSIRSANASSVESDLKHVYSLVLNPDSGWEHVRTHVVYTFTDSLGNINKWRQFERFAVKDGKVQRFAGSGQDIPEETE